MGNYQNLKFEDIDQDDYPDFVDAFISYAEYKDGIPLTEKELDDLNDSDLKYDLLMDYLH